MVKLGSIEEEAWMETNGFKKYKPQINWHQQAHMGASTWFHTYWLPFLLNQTRMSLGASVFIKWILNLSYPGSGTFTKLRD